MMKMKKKKKKRDMCYLDLSRHRPSARPARSLRSGRARAEARSLRSDRAIVPLGRYVATKLKPKLGSYRPSDRPTRSLRRDRARPEARSLRSDRAKAKSRSLLIPLGRYVATEFAGKLSYVMVELAGELTRVTVQLSGEWLLCGIRSFVHF
ncbi:hypothetical protein F2Q69_00011777 [Brassica cretica]|uniref:Uncharacterized protein n=1 Tax=Brassica cretica TaxID=69181 RepID=A0A8S9R2L0_BRACR|nr:hypothetical protein F2Q69_00011777 [Brassica cretica]